MNSLTIMKQVFSNPAHGWFELAMVVAVLAALIFQPERIRQRSRFGLACLLLALSIIAPSTMVLFINEMPGLGGLEAADVSMSAVVLMIAGPVLFAASFLVFVSSLLPPQDAPRDRKKPSQR